MSETILFLCPHHAAKSVIAAALFNQMAAQFDLPFTADSAGTDPDAAVMPTVVDLLKHEGLDVSAHQPRKVTAGELHDAARIISMGCTADELSISPENIEFWGDVPPVSQEPERARDVIRAHVEHLINELRVNS